MSSFNKRLRILLAPLDWGLGHTTRCIPIINELVKRNIEVFIAGTQSQHAILQKEFPQCHFLYLDGYNIRYHSGERGLSVKILRQVPTIISCIKMEHNWLEHVIKLYKINGVISDNRYGLFSHRVPCVFITHQLRIQTGIGKYADSWLQQFNYNRINKYTYCWIPDYEYEPNLAGNLSHSHQMPKIPCTYIGPLSRLEPLPNVKEIPKILFVISGPEPQRSAFEKKIFSQITYYEDPVTIVRGLPLATDTPLCGKAKVYNHLSKDELNRELHSAQYVVCRSGYSSVMDINAINAQAILIPTPGQTEQEYLAQYLMENKFALSCKQSEWNLKEMLHKAAIFPYRGAIPPQPHLLSQAIEKFINRCENA